LRFSDTRIHAGTPRTEKIRVSAAKMHADEAPTDAALVRRLLTAQFPHWAGLPIKPVPSAGTDNALYRLGEDMAVRLPRIPSAVGQVEKEQRWLPRLASHLPLAIPTPLAEGSPGDGYPYPWSVYCWLAGENATLERLADPRQAARDLAHFITALQQIDPSGGPAPGAHNSGRGAPLAPRDAETRAAIAWLHDNDMLDGDLLTTAWKASLQAPVWDGPPVWLHGDLQSGNLLASHGRLSAVIDFGCLGVGDPACDLMVAWTLLPADARDVFRGELPVDDATWLRGRGWALSFGLIALPYYLTTNPVLAGIGRYAVDEVLADIARGA
jgi:aminoglycoside phosphotransferase (APT) family kinase protein